MKVISHLCWQVSWSELPLELLLHIAERLDTRADILNFRRACKTWRSSAPLCLLTPQNILSPLFPLYPEVETWYYSVLVRNSVFLVQSATNPELPPWLLTVEEFTPGKLTIRRPLTSHIVKSKNLPEHFSYNLDLSKFHVSELGRFHSNTYVQDNIRVPGTSFVSYERVVLFVNPNCVTSSPTIDDCSVVELNGRMPLKVQRLGGQYCPDSVRREIFFKRRIFDDIVNFNDKIYGIDREGRVSCMDYDSLQMASVADDPLCESSDRNKKRLVVSCDELYLVHTIWYKKELPSFKVFKLNEEEGKWDRLEGGIGNDRLLFVTFDGCFFAQAKNFPQWRGNCIVSSKDSFPRHENTFEDIGILRGCWIILLFITLMMLIVALKMVIQPILRSYGHPRHGFGWMHV